MHLAAIVLSAETIIQSVKQATGSNAWGRKKAQQYSPRGSSNHAVQFVQQVAIIQPAKAFVQSVLAICNIWC